MIKLLKKFKPILLIVHLVILVTIKEFVYQQKAFGASLMKEICLTVAKSQIPKSKKNMATKIANFSCECFVVKLREGNSISSSKSECKEKAIEKFNYL